ncbi:MAG: putative 4-mercaptohistidine N1-methyltransferase [Gammaproteobacteria bacterium]|jgi:putative 4-mercaptohistidine N1-methyltranferase
MPDYYETDAQVNEYLVFHYANREQTLPWDFGPHQAFDFHARLVDCIDRSKLPDNTRALDLGCSVGRISLELSRQCTEVLGVDFSQAFINIANNLLENRKVTLKLKREDQLGDIVTNDLPSGLNPERVSFAQGDAEALPESIGRFDVIVFANVLDRLPHPKRALEKLADITNPGAQVVICSPYTWWDEFTDPEERLGGFMRDGKEVTSHDSIVDALEKDFVLDKTCDVPFVIREHERKFHFSVAQTSVWTRLEN